MITLPYDITCGYYDCSEFGDLNISPKRKTTKFEIEFYLEDGLATFADDKKYIIKKHYIQIAKPNQVRYSHLPFKTMFLKFSVDGEIAKRLQTTPEYFKCNHPEKIIEKLNEIILLNENHNNELTLYSRMLSLLNLVFYDSEISNRKISSNYKVISQAKRYIEENLKENINLKDIANSVNLSPIYFHNIFTAACGLSPHDYLIDCRIIEAKKQLWSSNIPMQKVAENCGFSSQPHLNRIFKKETGISPGQYRKAIQKNYLLD